jgi:hypothetical protein
VAHYKDTTRCGLHGGGNVSNARVRIVVQFCCQFFGIILHYRIDQRKSKKSMSMSMLYNVYTMCCIRVYMSYNNYDANNYYINDNNNLCTYTV